MNYQVLVLDLDGTLTNSKKEISHATRQALIDLQKRGKKVVLASGRPTQGVIPLARELHLETYNGYVLSYNGGRVISCKTGEVIYNRVMPKDALPQILGLLNGADVNLLTYTEDAILLEGTPNQYAEIESKINHLPVQVVDNLQEVVTFPVNKYLVTGESKIAAELETRAKHHFRSYLNIFRSEPYFLEFMPRNIDKAYSLLNLLSSLGMTADEMICCGDGYNDITMIECAGLGVAMENAQSIVLERADYITKSNDNDGILHVIEQFM